MPKGYMGKVLWVDLTKRTFTEEIIPDAVYQQFLSGYGLASKLIFDRQKPKVDPLGPDNILALMSGLLTNTPANFNGRWMVCAKSPLTGTWGDANSGGDLAPAIKETGYDGIFFTGQSQTPVFLLINGEDKQLIDASDLWGKDSNETEDTLQKRYGQNFKVACIGQGGENLSLISGIVNDKGRIAARSGLGAVMGSKKLKAICLAGTHEVEIANKEQMLAITRKFLDEFNTYKHPLQNRFLGWLMNNALLSGIIRYLTVNNIVSQPEEFNKYAMKRWGTASIVSFAANMGDSPVKNWKGVGCVDFKTWKARRISNNFVTRYETRKYKCMGCPLGCGGIMTVKGGPHPIAETHKPEYETLCGFGTMLLANDVRRIIKVNDMLNRAGIDTISCSVVVSWAFEAYEKGILQAKDVDGLELKWGNSEAVVQLVQKIIDGKGIGAILQKGVKRASEHFGADATTIAMHVGGQELPMHDCRNPQAGIGLGVAYEAEPTPGRHTSTLPEASLYRQTEDTLQAAPRKKFRIHTFHSSAIPNSEGQDLRDGSCFMDLVNGLGLCAFAWGNGVTPPIVDWANAATGWSNKFDDYMKIAHRIKTVRHSFNIREGIDTTAIRLPKRAAGVPPLKKGPNKNMTPDFEGGKREYFEAMGWNPDTAYPLPETLDALGLPEVKAALYAQTDKKEKASV